MLFYLLLLETRLTYSPADGAVKPSGFRVRLIKSTNEERGSLFSYRT